MGSTESLTGRILVMNRTGSGHPASSPGLRELARGDVCQGSRRWRLPTTDREVSWPLHIASWGKAPCSTSSLLTLMGGIFSRPGSILLQKPAHRG